MLEVNDVETLAFMCPKPPPLVTLANKTASPPDDNEYSNSSVLAALASVCQDSPLVMTIEAGHVGPPLPPAFTQAGEPST